MHRPVGQTQKILHLAAPTGCKNVPMQSSCDKVVMFYSFIPITGEETSSVKLLFYGNKIVVFFVFLWVNAHMAIIPYFCGFQIDIFTQHGVPAGQRKQEVLA